MRKNKMRSKKSSSKKINLKGTHRKAAKRQLRNKIEHMPAVISQGKRKKKVGTLKKNIARKVISILLILAKAVYFIHSKWSKIKPYWENFKDFLKSFWD